MEPTDFSSDDAADLTVSKSSLLAMRSAAEPASGSSAIVVTLESGLSIPLTGRLVVGRSPATGPADVPVAVTDLAVSKTHLAIEPAPGAAWITDLHSRNGVSLLLPDGEEVQLVPGRVTFAAIGTKALFGGTHAEIAARAEVASLGPAAGRVEPSANAPEPDVKPSARSAGGSLIAEVPLT